MKKTVTLFFLFITFLAQGQTVKKPNYGIKSHDALNIDSIKFTHENTVVYMRAVVPVSGSSFCVDKNTYLTSGSMRIKLLKPVNVSSCPDSKVYKDAGEFIRFELHFPPADSIGKYADLIEACTDQCFSFKGIILDSKFNSEIEDAYDSYAKSSTLSLDKFRGLIENHTDYKYGFAYINIIKILAEKNEMVKAHEWYVKMQNSSLYDKNELEEIIRKQAYYSLIK